MGTVPLILAFETSCDDTSVAIVRGKSVLSNVVSSQQTLHERWGGIVPEAAARAHVEAIIPVLETALREADIALEHVELIAATNRPGLVGSLSVGVAAARALALVLGVPTVGIHHLEGHLSSVLADSTQVEVPHLGLIASGGHTACVLVHDWGRYEVVGRTIDDAAGEAFDKASRLLSLGYPGGPAIQAAARDGNPQRYTLPRGLKEPSTDFSFSGLKTAVMRLVESEGEGLSVADAAASVEHTIVSVLAERSIRVAETRNCRAVTLVGGVAANQKLREQMAAECARRGLPLYVPSLDLCTDNAAMIGLAAAWRWARGERGSSELEVSAMEPLARP